MKLLKWSDVKRAKLDTSRLERVQQRVEKELLDANLAELRRAVGVTQVEAAEAAEMSQSELSRLERRPDHLVSTLRRYVESLGGELEVTAVVGNKRVRLKV
jgi:DNA-binding XRE family transcriptional regulator